MIIKFSAQYIPKTLYMQMPFHKRAKNIILSNKFGIKEASLNKVSFLNLNNVITPL